MYLNSGERPSGPFERLITSINIGQLFCVHERAAGGHKVYLGIEELSLHCFHSLQSFNFV